MKLSQTNYVFTTRIDIDNEGNFIELREPTSIELKDFDGENANKMELLKKLFPSCIVEHSFEDDNGDKSKNNEVAKVLEKSGSSYFEVINNWMSAIPFGLRRKDMKSAKPL